MYIIIIIIIINAELSPKRYWWGQRSQMEAKEGGYAVTTRMTNDAVTTTVTKSALRWAAMRAILMFQ